MGAWILKPELDAGKHESEFTKLPDGDWTCDSTNRNSKFGIVNFKIHETGAKYRTSVIVEDMADVSMNRNFSCIFKNYVVLLFPKNSTCVAPDQP
jgi:hypothetical protein